MRTVCVIPSRIGSTRLPRKPLLKIQGKPMIQMVYEAARSCQKIDQVIVATDSTEIAEVISACGGDVELTASDLRTGSDRVAAVAQRHPEADVIINLQGDEPFMTATMLELLIAPFATDTEVVMSTLASPLKMNDDYTNPGIVKVITDRNQDALYFSRSPIPYLRNSDIPFLPVYHHMGIYAFRRDFLLTFTQLEQTPLELAESLEQLRALENGFKIRVSVTKEATLEINTAEDFEKAQTFHR